jgi:hypothetical protein
MIPVIVSEKGFHGNIVAVRDHVRIGVVPVPAYHPEGIVVDIAGQQQHDDGNAGYGKKGKAG